MRAVAEASRASGGGRNGLIVRARHHLDLDAVNSRVASLESRVSALEAAARIGAVTTWIRNTRLETTAPVSVVLATHNRCELLCRAIDSVRAQEYAHWELVIVDDGSSDNTPALLAHLSGEDERIVVATRPHRGPAAARNAALAMVTSDIVCYLDDDNTMEPLWLKAVAWAFGQYPDVHLVYGARVMDADAGDEPGQDPLPVLQFDPFDRVRLEAVNFIDLGVLAHRRTHPEAHFDEQLDAMEDWDLLLRLTADQPPMPLPVVASMYTTSAPNRVSRSGRPDVAGAVVAARLRDV